MVSYLDDEVTRLNGREWYFDFLEYLWATSLGDGNGVDLGRVFHSERTRGELAQCAGESV